MPSLTDPVSRPDPAPNWLWIQPPGLPQPQLVLVLLQPPGLGVSAHHWAGLCSPSFRPSQVPGYTCNPAQQNQLLGTETLRSHLRMKLNLVDWAPKFPCMLPLPACLWPKDLRMPQNQVEHKSSGLQHGPGGPRPAPITLPQGPAATGSRFALLEQAQPWAPRLQDKACRPRLWASGQSPDLDLPADSG